MIIFSLDSSSLSGNVLVGKAAVFFFTFKLSLSLASLAFADLFGLVVAPVLDYC